MYVVMAKGLVIALIVLLSCSFSIGNVNTIHNHILMVSVYKPLSLPAYLLLVLEHIVSYLYCKYCTLSFHYDIPAFFLYIINQLSFICF